MGTIAMGLSCYRVAHTMSTRRILLLLATRRTHLLHALPLHATVASAAVIRELKTPGLCYHHGDELFGARKGPWTMSLGRRTKKGTWDFI